MSTHGPVARILIGLGLLSGLILVLASSVVLHGYTMVVVALTAALVACVAYSTRDGGGPAARAVACTAAAWTVAIIMLVTGVVVVAGSTAAVLASGLIAAVGGAVVIRRVLRARSADRGGSGRAAGRRTVSAAPTPLAVWLDRSPTPVARLPISGLGLEWSRTTAALATRLEPALRQVVVRRRQEVLDELERRDPAVFTRWLAAGAPPDGDPASFVRGDRTTGTDAA